MSTRAALGLSLFITLHPGLPTRAADPLSTQTLTTRLAGKPTGEAATALAEDVRAWFGKDRSGKYNVATGANPKVDGLITAWAIEAPRRKPPRSHWLMTKPGAHPNRRDARLRRSLPD